MAAPNMNEKKKNTHCRWCSAPNCSNSRNKRPDLSFLSFPLNPQISKQWIVNCRRKDLEDRTPEDLHNNCFICSEHFEPCCFSKTAKKRKIILKTAVPTLFNIRNPPPKLTPSRPPPKDRQFVNFTELPEDSPTTDLCSTVDETPETNVEFKEQNIVKSKLCAERSKNWRLRKKLTKLTDRSPHQPTASTSTGSICDHSSSAQQDQTEPRCQQVSIQNVEQILHDYLPRQAVSFVMTQIRVGKLPKKSRRWSFEDKSFALSLFHASKKAYNLLQRLFQLPSPSTLALAMKNVQIEPGLCSNVLNLFRIKVRAMAPTQRTCAIVFDEMAIKSDLSYDPSRDLVEGFEDYGLLGRTRKSATHALVFMVKGLCTKWKQPLSYVLSCGPVRSDMLLLLLQDVVKEVFSLGLHPKAIICDQGSNNRSMIQQLGVTQNSPFFVINQHKIFVLYDPPHLLKSIRNNLRNSGYKVDGKTISWEYIRKFYEMDSAQPIRMAPKLTSRHINMPVFSNLRVSLAAQVLSHTVAAGITTMVYHHSLPQDALQTAEFVEKFDQLFNSFNSRSLKSKGTMSNAISVHSKHEIFLQQIRNWLESIKPQNKSGSLPCLEGWKLSIEALLQLWKHLRDECGFKFLLTSRLNQDCLENLFSIIRAKGGHRVNPTCREFRLALRQTMVDAVLVPGSNKNCKDDIDAFLFSFQNMVSMGAQSSIKSRLQQDVPRQLQQVMRGAPPVFSTTETNILNYIGGYVGMKLKALLCDDCKAGLVQAQSAQNPAHTFICKKNFTVETGGLCAPSNVLMNTLTVAEKSFRSHIDPYIHKTGLRMYLVRKVMEATYGIGLQCKNAVKQCDIHFLVINLFINVRLHHHVRCMATQQTSKINTKSTERKAATFQNK